MHHAIISSNSNKTFLLHHSTNFSYYSTVNPHQRGKCYGCVIGVDNLFVLHPTLLTKKELQHYCGFVVVFAMFHVFFSEM